MQNLSFLLLKAPDSLAIFLRSILVICMPPMALGHSSVIKERSPTRTVEMVCVDCQDSGWKSEKEVLKEVLSVIFRYFVSPNSSILHVAPVRCVHIDRWWLEWILCREP